MHHLPFLRLRLPAAALLLLAALPAQGTTTTTAPALPTGAPAAMAEIQAADLLAHATWLASDERGGRLTGSPGQEAAAQYIAEHFRTLGLEPLGDEVEGEDGTQARSFFQSYGITRTAIDPASRLTFGDVVSTTGFAMLGAKPVQLDLKGPLVWAGQGRTRGRAADLAADTDLKGKVAMFVLKPPRGRIDRTLSIEHKFGLAFTALGGMTRTVQGLGKLQPAAIVVGMTEDPFGLSDVLNMMGLSPGKDLLSPRFDGGMDQMGMLGGMLGGGDVPVLVLGPELTGKALGQLGLGTEAVQQWLGGEGELPAAKTDVEAAIALAVTKDDAATAKNVVAVLRGSDPQLQAEAIVYSAHMDHVGGRLDGEVFNGADDNASGSAGLLGIARAFARSAEKPRRSIIFLSVSGEELGLWGSAYYADHPTWPADQIVANINTDMIGRSGPESGPMQVTVTPSHRHEMFSTIVQDAAALAEHFGVAFEDGDKYYTRSDHFNFAKKGIPVVFFCNGEHEDYHQVTDHADKLDAQKMERIARLAFWTGWNVANADERPRTLGRRQDWKR